MWSCPDPVGQSWAESLKWGPTVAREPVHHMHIHSGISEKGDVSQILTRAQDREGQGPFGKMHSNSQSPDKPVSGQNRLRWTEFCSHTFLEESPQLPPPPPVCVVQLKINVYCEERGSREGGRTQRSLEEGSNSGGPWGWPSSSVSPCGVDHAGMAGCNSAAAYVWLSAGCASMWAPWNTPTSAMAPLSPHWPSASPRRPPKADSLGTRRVRARPRSRAWSRRAPWARPPSSSHCPSRSSSEKAAEAGPLTFVGAASWRAVVPPRWCSRCPRRLTGACHSQHTRGGARNGRPLRSPFPAPLLLPFPFSPPAPQSTLPLLTTLHPLLLTKSFPGQLALLAGHGSLL